MNLYEVEVSKVENIGGRINFDVFTVEVCADSEYEVFEIVLEEEGSSAKVETIKLLEEGI